MATLGSFRGILLAGAVCVVSGGLAREVAAQMPAPAGPKPARARAASPYASRLFAAARRAHPPSRTLVAESEPNDSLTTADPFTLLDSVAGVVNPAGDVDFYVVTLTAGIRVELDIDAQVNGSPLDPVLALFDSSGFLLAFNDDTDGLDSYIAYSIAVTGRYYVGVAEYSPAAGGANYSYLLKTSVQVPGPGDPTTLFATGLGTPSGVAATATGDLLVADQFPARIARVTLAGATSDYVTFVPGRTPYDVVIDGLGDLLVAVSDSGFAGAVLRITVPTSPPTYFARWAGGSAEAITVGPDGDVWVADNNCRCLRRFDAVGTRKDSIPTGGRFVWDLAFSPSGELHASSAAEVARLVGGALQAAITAPAYLEGLAFDRDGYLYVANGFLGLVNLYTPQYQQVGSVFARSNLGGPIALVFGRSAAGAMTSRLFAANVGYNLQPPYIGSLVEMNPAGMRAIGHRVGVDLLRVAPLALRAGVVGADYADTLRLLSPPPGAVTWSVVSGTLPAGVTLAAATGVIAGVPQDPGSFQISVRGNVGAQFGAATYTIAVTRPQVTGIDAASALLGASGVLTPAQERFLDLQGNRNGRFDVADLRAYLRSQNLLPHVARSSPGDPARHPEEQ